MHGTRVRSSKAFAPRRQSDAAPMSVVVGCRRCRVRPLPHRVHERGLYEAGDCRAILEGFRQLSANALRRAGCSLADRGGTCRALADHVATQNVLALRVGHCRQLCGVAVRSVAVARSVGRAVDTTAARSTPQTVRRRVIRIRRTAALRGFCRWRSRIKESSCFNRLLMGQSVNQTAILLPFVGTMLLTIVVWSYMYARRIPFILRNNLTPQQLTPAELARLSPSEVANPSDNLKNLFELPRFLCGGSVSLRRSAGRRVVLVRGLAVLCVSRLA